MNEIQWYYLKLCVLLNPKVARQIWILDTRTQTLSVGEIQRNCKQRPFSQFEKRRTKVRRNVGVDPVFFLVNVIMFSIGTFAHLPVCISECSGPNEKCSSLLHKIMPYGHSFDAWCPFAWPATSCIFLRVQASKSIKAIGLIGLYIGGVLVVVVGGRKSL